jgi:flagellar hook-associated protein 2
MANAINNANLGVRATVETDSETNQSVLRVESTTTGADTRHSFTIEDVAGDFAEHMGIDTMTTAGQNAIFSVNGEQRTSQSNTVNLGQGVTATLRQASDEVIRIETAQDRNAIRSNINDMVRSFNNLFSAAAENVKDPRAQDLANRLLDTVRTFSRGLNEIGITFDDSGRMRINNDRMNQAMENGRLEQFFTQNAGMNFGFTNQLERLASNVSRNPGNFVTNTMTGGNFSGGSGGMGLGNQMHFGSLNTGMLFDFMF